MKTKVMPSTLIILVAMLLAAMGSALRANNTIGDADSMNINGTFSGSINPAGDRDFIRLSIPSPGTLTLYSTGSTDLYGRLYNSQGGLITSNDDGGTERNFRISRYVGSGTYYLQVTHYSSYRTGSYVIYSSFQGDVPDDHANSASGATAFSLNTGLNGSINSPGDNDWMRVSLTQSGTLVLYTTGITDVYGRLYDANLNLLAYDDDSGVDRNFRMERNLRAGTYYLRVSHYSSTGIGNYIVYNSFTPDSSDAVGDTLGTALSVSPNSTHIQSIDRAGDVDVFRLDLGSSGNLRVFTTGTTDTFGTLTRGSTSLRADDDSGQNLNFSINTAVSSGTHYIMVRHFSRNGLGSYTLNIRFDGYGAPDSGAIVTVNLSGNSGSSSGAIDRPGDSDWYRFNVSQPGTLVLYSTGTTDTYGRLYNSSRTRMLAFSDDHNGNLNFRISHEVAATTTLFLRISHYSTVGTGPYGLIAQFTPAGSGGGSNPGTSGGRVAVVAGISNYQYINDLSLCDDDAVAISNLLRSRGWSVTTLIDNQASKAGIANALRNAVSTNPAELMFAFSGHGTRSGTTGYLCTYDGQSNSGFISEGELSSWLGDGSSPSMRVGIMLDSCHSGEFISSRSVARVADLRNARFFTPIDAPRTRIRDARAGVLFARDLQRNGWTVLTGCRGAEYSYELSSLGHGWLSYQFINRMPAAATDIDRNTRSSIEELHSLIRGGYNGVQHPQLYDGDPTRKFDMITVR